MKNKIYFFAHVKRRCIRTNIIVITVRAQAKYQIHCVEVLAEMMMMKKESKC